MMFRRRLPLSPLRRILCRVLIAVLDANVHLVAAAGLVERPACFVQAVVMASPGDDSTTLFPGSGHDHDRCVEDAMAEAAAVCRDRQARLTPLRARVLELVWQSHKPLGAYAILEMLAQEGHSPAPPTVYRALEFLLKYGLVHRIASLNAFTGCSHPGHAGAGQFLICRDCGSVAELGSEEIARAIENVAKAKAFTTDMHTVEITGLCPHCQAA